jgi:octaheme c-type cytochrome (tetrathionate reductase family)
MSRLRRLLAPLAAAALVLALLVTAVARRHERRGPDYVPKTRVHLDHSAYFKAEFKDGRDVTAACLKCHAQAGRDVLASTHWTWLGDKVQRPGMKEPLPIGKKNLINNFCIGIQGNWPSCTKCHAGYGWKDAQFDFKDARAIDCLVCHDWSGQYVKGQAGEPAKGVDLLAAAKSVGYPKRQNCSTCHSYGGGGLGVKHGDLDNSLENPAESLDVHMGGQGMLCIDCHAASHHQIPGRSFAVSVQDQGGIGCVDCHKGVRHQDQRIERHFSAVACQTCHIPSFARRVPTKKTWDWSKAGDASRPEDPHHYLKIKGEFTYEQDVKPDYAWFNGKVDRYLAGDPIAEPGPTQLNRPLGGIQDPQAKIWPFKIHTARQPYDAVYKRLIIPVTAGSGTEKGFWTDFDWQEAARESAKHTGQPYSGKLGFTDTVMAWPLSHMVTPKDKALRCVDCHGAGGRLDFKALGYAGDPAQTGGRKP